MSIDILLPVICGFLSRLDGKGSEDPVFLPFWPLNNIKGCGINYMRYGIGLFVWAVTQQWIFILTYSLAVSVPWGEKHWWMKYGVLSWFVIGCLFGAASLSWGNALWCGMLVVVMKYFDTDHAVFECMLGGLGTLYFVFN